MSFIEAALQANRELFQLLHVKGLEESHYQSFAVGAGGDLSSGIDLVAEKRRSGGNDHRNCKNDGKR